MSQIGEYTILPITIPSTPAYPKATTHTVYLRPHAPKIPTENDSRSLFLVNVPIDSTSAHLRALFTSLLGTGRFESASFEHENKTTTASTPITTLALSGASTAVNKKRKRGDDVRGGAGGDEEGLPQIWDRELRRSGSTAVVTLVDERSVEVAIKAARKLGKKGKEGERYIWGEGVGVPSLGSARYAAHQRLRYPSKVALQRHVDDFITAFTEREEERAREAKRVRNVPDADGFVTVVRGGRTGPARMEDAERKRAELEEKEGNKRGAMQEGGFYRFQVRERRKVEQGELVRRFEEDRKRVEGMRKGRKGGFRPEV
ncbi:ribosomal RNA-processing protein 7-domain-containing protein [Rhexocercosporidium sp. MPI-PUGE-AT-0058]|nr:ribosomal RNA-processing protein 7-domain-containing protein [Rhexocercosporidium sp. MPI-PUGE-AT-0058]